MELGLFLLPLQRNIRGIDIQHQFTRARRLTGNELVNTREAPWDAMARKDGYVTTRTRLEVLVFAGNDFKPNDLIRADWNAYGYAKGVPTGEDLRVDASGAEIKAPMLSVKASRAPEGANLDRIQVIKGGWTRTVKRWKKSITLPSRAREPGKTVDAKDASYNNRIGAPTLEACWQDPTFMANGKAYYYVRVLVIPTPCWTSINAKVFGIDLPKGVSTTIQERAYTSPIWVNAN